MNELFPYTGPEASRGPIERALATVVDPEMAINIVDLGLVYGVDVAGDRIAVRLTMTSAACPVAELIIDDIEAALSAALGSVTVDVALCWDPPWTPERMSDAARDSLGW